MKNIIKKIRRIVAENVTMYVSFGFIVSSRLLFLHIKNKLGVISFGEYEEKKHPIIENYLIKKGYRDILIKSYNLSGSVVDSSEKSSSIWFCWLQGEENMPDLVKVCYSKLKENSGCHEVVLITSNNYSKYVEIPLVIEEKYKQGKLLPAHFADLLRLKLLLRYGGLWIDSTIYTTAPLPEYMFEENFFSIKNKKLREDNSISYYRWCSFVLGHKRPVIKALSIAFQKYIENEKSFIHYLLIDYMIDLLYKNVEDFRLFIDETPIREQNLHSLRNYMNAEYDDEMYRNLLSNTTVFKLTYKGRFYEKQEDGKETFYGHLIGEKLKDISCGCK